MLRINSEKHNMSSLLDVLTRAQEAILRAKALSSLYDTCTTETIPTSTALPHVLSSVSEPSIASLPASIPPHLENPEFPPSRSNYHQHETQQSAHHALNDSLSGAYSIKPPILGQSLEVMAHQPSADSEVHAASMPHPVWPVQTNLHAPEPTARTSGLSHHNRSLLAQTKERLAGACTYAAAAVHHQQQQESRNIAGTPGDQEHNLHQDLGDKSAHPIGEGDLKPMLAVASKLATLRRQQEHTLQQLLDLRLEQLRLRQQQLEALCGLLVSEVAAIDSTPLQSSAVEQAVALLHQCLEDMELVAGTVGLTDSLADISLVLQAVLRADGRADEVSRMARQLLLVLREFPRRDELVGSSIATGATEEQIQLLPTYQYTGEPADVCAICLSEYCTGDAMKSLRCAHSFHSACLGEWLRIRASCPLCKCSLQASSDSEAGG